MAGTRPLRRGRCCRFRRGQCRAGVTAGPGRGADDGTTGNPRRAVKNGNTWWTLYTAAGGTMKVTLPDVREHRETTANREGATERGRQSLVRLTGKQHSNDFTAFSAWVFPLPRIHRTATATRERKVGRGRRRELGRSRRGRRGHGERSSAIGCSPTRRRSTRSTRPRRITLCSCSATPSRSRCLGNDGIRRRVSRARRR